MTCAQQLRLMRHLSTTAELRQVYQYDSFCPMACAAIVELLTGMTFTRFLDQEIFGPIGMKSSFGNSNDTRATGRFASGHLRRGGDLSREGPSRNGATRSVGWWTQDDGLWCLPAGGVAMNIQDAVSCLDTGLG